MATIKNLNHKNDFSRKNRVWTAPKKAVFKRGLYKS